MKSLRFSKSLHISISRLIISVLFVFLLLFPKGGIKIAGIPLTWGYGCLLAIAYLLSFKRILKLSVIHAVALLSLVPFVLTCLLGMMIQGVDSIGFMFSYLVSFIVMPLIFLGVFPDFLKRIDKEFLFKWILKGTYFIAFYGISLFFYKIITKKFFEIPMLTINYHDRESLESLKCIDRGGFFKLISTYNNGNIYGICLLMFFPLVITFEKSLFKKTVIRLSLLLTISRTVWLGWLFAEVLILLFLKKGLFRFVQIFLMVGIIGLGLTALALYFSLDSSFFFDEYLGNRLGQFEVLKELHMMAAEPFDFVFEVIYLGVLRSFGFLGLMTFLIGMLAPLILHMLSYHKKVIQPIYKKAIAIGLVTYLFMGCADGAILYIPVMCFYWFLSSWLLNSHPLEEGIKQKKLLACF